MVTHNATRLATFLSKHRADIRFLPAVRIVTVNAFDHAMGNGFLALNEEGLLHFFYGKPSYKLSNNGKMPNRFIGDAGVCFVFDLTKLPAPSGLFALDTGAFKNKRYDNFLSNGVVLEDFRLPLEYDSLPRLVDAFFGDNEAYYDGNVKANLKVPPMDLASGVYANLISSAVIDQLDERACTAEIQIDEVVEIGGAKLVTAILPGMLYDDPEVRQFFDRLKLKPILYRFRRAKPEERTEVIYQKLGEFLDAKGYFRIQ
jgi:hypothetical protein